MSDVFEIARWVVQGRLRPWEVANESVVEMARKLVESLAALEASQQALNETIAKAADAVAAEREAQITRVGEAECEARIASSVAQEREDCAQVCDAFGWNENDPDPARQWRRDNVVDRCCRELGTLIRKRGSR